MSQEPRTSDRRMSAFDALLYRGDADPSTRSILIAAGVLHRSPHRSDFVAAVDRATRLVLRLRQRVVDTPLSVMLPAWSIDPDFDLAYHVRFLHVDPPGTLVQLLGIVQSEATRPLDPARPLWEMLLVEGFEGGRAAVVIRMSHAISDGIGIVRLFSALFDDRPDVDHGPMPPAPIPEDLTPYDVIEGALRRGPGAIARLAGRSGSAIARRGRSIVRDAAPALRGLMSYVDSTRRVLAPDCTPSPLLTGRSLRRRCLTFDIPLAQMKKAGHVSDASLNDVYLAGLVSALRRYHLALGVTPGSVPLAIPVNLRAESDASAGNRFGVIVIAAPLDVPDPARRLSILKEQVRSGRAERAIAAPAEFATVLARLPEWLRQQIALRTPRPDVQASNLPGPKTQIYIAGCRVERMYAFGPIPGVAAMFALQSLAGTCHVGVNADAAAIVEIETFAGCLHDGFDEVLPKQARGRKLAVPVIGVRALDAPPA